uniref:Uncharacterized protein n=1 Tax=Panagrolaimus sp. ES5 TaxID=591445 RepID=A0AC34F3H6_9BILA
MILQNADIPLDISQDHIKLNFRPVDWDKLYPRKKHPTMDSFKGTYEVSWYIDKMKFNPSDYYVGIYVYEAIDITIFEEYSSLFLAFLIAFVVILILLCFGICGGGIYLGFFTKYYNIKKFKISESNQPELSFGYNENEGEKIESKSDSNEMVNDEHLVECDCIECNEDQKDKEKLIRSIIPDVQKLISDCINDGIDQKYLVPQSQAAFIKLIKKEMKRRNLKPKKNDIEEVVQKLVTKENVKAAVEQRKTSSNLGMKIKDDLKV